MRIILTRAIATEYLGSIPRGTVLDISVDVGEHLVARGFARVDEVAEQDEGVVHDGIIREFDGADEGYEWPTVAEDSGGGSDGTDGPAG